MQIPFYRDPYIEPGSVVMSKADGRLVMLVGRDVDMDELIFRINTCGDADQDFLKDIKIKP